MNILGACIVVVVFALLIHLTRLVDRSRDVVTIGRRTAQLMGDKSISDEIKEQQTQRNALAMFRLLGVLTAGTLVALFVPLGIVWGVAWLGVLSFDGVLDVLVSWPFIIGGSVLGVVTYIAARKWLKPGS